MKINNKLNRKLSDREYEVLEEIETLIEEHLDRTVYSITINPPNNKYNKVLWGIQIALKHDTPKTEDDDL